MLSEFSSSRFNTIFSGSVHVKTKSLVTIKYHSNMVFKHKAYKIYYTYHVSYKVLKKRIITRNEGLYKFYDIEFYC